MKIERIFFDFIGNKGLAGVFVRSVGRVLKSIKGDFGGLENGLQKERKKADILSIAMKVNETFLGLPADCI